MHHICALLFLLILCGSPQLMAADLDDAVAANEENQQNLARLVNVIRSLQQNGAATGNLSDLLAHFSTLDQPALVNRGLQALLPEVTRLRAHLENNGTNRGTRPHRSPQHARTNTTRAVQTSWSFATPANNTAGKRSIADPNKPFNTSGLRWLSAAPTQEAARSRHTDVWLQAWLDDAQQDDADGFDGFDATGRGIATGFDYNLTPALSVGLSVGEYHADVDSQQFGEDDSRNRTWGASAYYTREQKTATSSVFHQWHLDYSNSSYEIDRERLMLVIADDTLRRLRLVSDIDARQYSIGAGYALSVDLPAINVQPFLNLTYSKLRTDDYVENGGGSLNLLVDSADQEQFLGSIGTSMSWAFFTDNWLISPSITAAFEHDFHADPSISVARFRGTDALFTTQGYAIEENRWRYSVSISFLHSTDFGISVSYQGQHKDDYSYQGATVNLQARL